MAIIKRGESYRVSVYAGIDERTGKKIYHWETVKGWQAAKDRHTELINEQRNGTLVKLKKITVSDFVDKWLRDYAKPNLRPRVYEVYESIYRIHVIPEIGRLQLTSLTTPRIDEYYSNRLVYGLSAQTIVHHHTLLHKAFETAIEWGLLSRNPANNAHPPKVHKPEMSTFNVEEFNKFLDAAKQTDYYAMFMLSLREGVRRSELLALRWRDVDDLFLSISVNRSLYVGKGRRIVFLPPKTAKGKRLIPLTLTSSLVVKEYYNKCKDIANQLKVTFNDDTLVFCHLDTGEPYFPNTVTRAWSRIAKIANVKHIRLHDARHTMATIMLQEGVHPKIVQERLGHSSITITLDTYSHVTPSMQNAAAKSLEDALKVTYNKDGEKPAEKVTDCQNIAKQEIGTLVKT